MFNNQPRTISFEEKMRRVDSQLLSDIDAVRKSMGFKKVEPRCNQKLANEIYAALNEKPAQPVAKPAVRTVARPDYETLEDTGRGHMTSTGFSYYLTDEQNRIADDVEKKLAAKNEEKINAALARGLSLDDIG